MIKLFPIIEKHLIAFINVSQSYISKNMMVSLLKKISENISRKLFNNLIDGFVNLQYFPSKEWILEKIE